jgi:uncharacterized protein
LQGVPANEKLPSSSRVRFFAEILAKISIRHAKHVLWVSWALALVGVAIATRLTVKGDFSSLLPPDAPSVVQLHRLEHRTRVLADYMVGVEADSPQLREAAFNDLRARVETIDPSLISGIIADQHALHRYLWNNRYLFTSLNDLETARDTLRDELERLSPWSLHLGQDEKQAAPDPLAQLEAQFSKLKVEADEKGEFISADRHLQMMIVRTTFTADDSARGLKITRVLQDDAQAIERAFPGTKVGMTGDVINTGAEHRALQKGMLLSVLLTVGLVLAALLLFYRSITAVGALAWSLTVAVVLTFAFAKLTIGYLNMASAFLSSIVIGNGINCGLIVTARVMEPRQEGSLSEDAIIDAAVRSAPATLTASATAAAAYGALALTQFRGFRDFGMIGAAGMLLCWLSAFTVLPAALYYSRRHVGALRVAWMERIIERIVPQRRDTVVMLGVSALVLSTVAAVSYVAHDPFEDNLRHLRSDAVDVGESSRWMRKFDHAFGNGLSGGFAIGVDERSQTQEVVAKLRHIDAGKPLARRTFSKVTTLDDYLPQNQSAKLEVLAEIRHLLDSPMWTHASTSVRQKLQAYRPPDTLRLLTESDVPEQTAFPYTERDGTRGRLILANTGLGVNTWSLKSLHDFTRQMRAVDFGSPVVIGGTAFVFSEMFDLMKSDGIRASLIALVASASFVMLLLGVKKPGWITLACAALGILGMLSIVYACGIKVNFLDFAALPITIGIGVDYSVNIAARAHQMREPDAGRRAVKKMGPVVALCSYTTVVGYGALLFSLNRGIRSFGLCAMIGEMTCLVAALVIAPSLLDWSRRRADAAATLRQSAWLQSPRNLHG